MAYDESIALDPDAWASTGLAWLTWHVKDTQDGKVLGGNFSLRASGSGREVIDLTGATGVCFDWPTSKIGWIENDGTAGKPPRKFWSPTRSKLIPQPNENCKRAFWVQLCIFIDDEPVRVIWEQAQEAAWKGYRDLMTQLAPAAPKELPKLPLIICTGHSPIMVPQFKVPRYIERPTCLPKEPKDDNGSGYSNSRAVSQGSGLSGAPKNEPLPLLDDEIPF
jgi:hypothetical protein